MSLSSPRVLIGIAIVLAIVAIPLTIIQIQQQQELRQRAAGQTAQWTTAQSASTSCPDTGGAVISVTFSNTEPNQSDLAMNVKVTDQQTGKNVDLGSISGGQTKTGQIQTDQETLQGGSVVFDLTWSDGHSGTDSRTASYEAVNNCGATTPTPSITTTPTSTPSGTVTPTICPTLGPVKNVHIECPDCK